MGPNTAFCLIIFGLLGVYCEFIWPGRVWQIVVGSAAAITGGYYLWRAEPTLIGLELLALSTFLFLLDAYLDSCFIAGIAATAALTFGFAKLIPGPHGIRPLLAIPWCLAFGIITLVLNSLGRRARRNKYTGV